MHTKRFNRDCLWGLAVGLVLTLAPGCELLVDFDRSLIPNDASPSEASIDEDAGELGDGGSPDATLDADAANPDATLADATADASGEASAEAATPNDGAPGDATGNVDASDAAANVDASDGASADATSDNDASDGT